MKFAVIGCGHIGKRHIEMINRNPDCELMLCCDSDYDVWANLPSVHCFPDLDKVFNSGIDFDVLVVSTPNGLHYEHARKGLLHNKHVIIEKPFCLDSIDCQNLITLAREVNKKIFCVMQNRYSPPAEWLKSIIPSLGQIHLIQVNCFWNRDERYYTKGGWRGTVELDGGTLFTQFSHFIDMVLWLFGSIQVDNVKLFDFNHKDLTTFEDSGFIQFSVDKAKGQFNYSTSCYNENLESSITIIAENGSVKIGGQYMNKVEYCHIKDYIMPELTESEPANDYGAYKGSASNHHKVYENVIDVLLHGKEMTTTPIEEFEVVKLIENIYAVNRRQNPAHR